MLYIPRQRGPREALGSIDRVHPVEYAHPLLADLEAWWLMLPWTTSPHRIWDFGKNRLHASPNSVEESDITIAHDVPFNVFGPDGGNDWFISDPTAAPGTGGVTIAVWVRDDEGASGGFTSVMGRTWDHFSDTRTWTLGGVGSNAQQRVVFYDSSGTEYVASTGITTGVWHRLVGVRDGGEVRIYRDGFLMDTDTAISSSTALGDDPGAMCYIGMLGLDDTDSSGAEEFDGGIAHPMVWNRALSDEDVYDLDREMMSGYPTMLRRKRRSYFFPGIIRVDADVTLGSPSVSIDATAPVTVDADVTLGSPSVSVDAQVRPVVDVDVTLGSPSVSVDATATVTVDADVALDAPTVSADVSVVPTADVEITLGSPTVSADATARVIADLNVTLGSPGISADVTVQVGTDVNVTLGSPSVNVVATNSVGADEVLIRGTIGGNVVPFRARSVEIDQEVGRCDSVRFAVMVGPDESAPLREGEPVEVYNDERQEDLLWAGTVQRYAEVDQEGAEDYTREILYEGICYSALAERFFVAEAYADISAGDIVRNLVNKYLADDDVTVTQVEDGPTIDAANFPDIKLAEAFEDLQERTGYYWFIDENKDMVFRPRASNISPIEFTDSNKPYRRLVVERGKKEYRNVQIIKAGEDLTTVQRETFVGDGERQVFTVSLPVGQKPTVKVDGVEKSVGIRNVGSQTEDWFWNKGRTEISQNDSNAPLTSSEILTIEYRGLVPIKVVARDTNQIAERKQIEGGSGVYEAISFNPEINERNDALTKGDSLLARFAQISEDMEFEIDDTRLRKGQIILVNLTSMDLDDSYLVKRLRWRLLDDNQFRLTASALSGDSVGGWVDYFRRLQQSRRKFVIRENEQVFLQRRTKDTVTVEDSNTISSQSFEPLKIGSSDGIGFSSIGDITHEDRRHTDPVTVSDSSTISSDTNEGFRIGTDGVGFASLGYP